MAEDYRPIIVGLLILALVVVLFFEFRYLRSRRTSKAEADRLPDQAHNALTTSKAIMQLVSRRGGDVSEARELIQEAELAVNRGNHRVAIELSKQAKSSLRSTLNRLEEEAASVPETEGAAEDAVPPEEGGAEPTAVPPEDYRTTKEVLQEEFPEGYLQAKFSLNTAREKLTGADPASDARRLLDEAELAFERDDYASALSLATQAQRSEREVPEPSIEAESACSECGASLKEGDLFCRKCGAEVEVVSSCPECGREAKTGDSFCRGCGSSLA
jgi:hypothetical protein